MLRLLRAAAAVSCAFLAWDAQAFDAFSPGDLSAAHAELSGIQNCTKCHPAGKKLSEERCLACHQELVPSITEGRGFHGHIAAKDRACWKCHLDHQGSDFDMIPWGEGGPKSFDHASAGAPLVGKHRNVSCEKCHDPDLINDERVESLLESHPQRRTFLGAPPMKACASCHFDEHRGQMTGECSTCHDDRGWKPASGFNHARTAYPLTGAHRNVSCEKCHSQEEEKTPPDPGALTAPVSPDHFTRFRPQPHASCLDCHRDPHGGQYGDACARCHTTEEWKKVVAQSPAERAFHEKTRYPLKGSHQFVSCIACHGPFPGEPARFKGLPFQACTDCHADAHVGQMARRGPASGACERCHDVSGFQPARFTVEDHDKTGYKLLGAHRSVACAACHAPDARLAERFPAQQRAELTRRKRPVTVALAVYRVAGDLNRCETCHADPHGGQLERKGGCASCHNLESFRGARFDHARESRFPLTGRHAQAACDACHVSRPSPTGPVVRYKPLPIACAGCHDDPHASQFATPVAPKKQPKGAKARQDKDVGPTDCARCHGTSDWKVASFRHGPPFTDFELTGSHKAVTCAKCHPTVQVAPNVNVQRFRPLPRSCDGCHVDVHKGSFKALEASDLTGATPLRPTPAVKNRPVDRCGRCHNTERWTMEGFAHDNTGFPLRGAHLRVSCKACHTVAVTAALGRSCGVCHRDVHQGRLGVRCVQCHEETTWVAKFDADAHRRTNFPLTGRHAFLACEECHGNKLNRGFSRPTPGCAGCHLQDYQHTAGTIVDHAAAGFSTQCQQCHQTRRFRGATLPQHDTCFIISKGPHAEMSCLACHTALTGVTITGGCASGTAACTRCHSCAQHPAVPGFGCVEVRCAFCHQQTFASGLKAGAIPRSP